jgi:hypothetical protein
MAADDSRNTPKRTEYDRKNSQSQGSDRQSRSLGPGSGEGRHVETKLSRCREVSKKKSSPSRWGLLGILSGHSTAEITSSTHVARGMFYLTHFMLSRNPHLTSVFASVLAPILCALALLAFSISLGARSSYGFEGVAISILCLGIALIPFVRSRATACWWRALRSLSVCLCAWLLIVTLSSYFIAWKLDY